MLATDTLLPHVEQYIRVSEALREALLNRVRVASYGKGQLLHDARHVCTRSDFIQRGLVRLYYLRDGEKVTESFSAEGEWVNSPNSFIKRVPDIYYLEALEPTHTLSLQVQDLGYLFDTFPEMERYARLSMGSVFGHLMDRITSLRFTSAKEKYAHFCDTHHDILPRLPLGMVASYLGITQETLSRIRAER
ncbi:Crp/Fnr family transcriptional regulator [Hymenobacter fastidiosus]|uniref:Crp/Fnr family transcriptional regulator n=1 Tax=Hymenobacter fastidiosus TaxID=486264 RepID=A0ABP7RC79_9BACT